MKIIPISASCGITGFASPAAEYTELGCSLDELLVEHPSSTYLGACQGDSMIGVGIFNGDILVVDRYVNASHNDVIVATINGEFVCKILDVHNRALVSANPEVDPIYISECDNFSVEGVVTRSIRLFKPSHLLSGGDS